MINKVVNIKKINKLANIINLSAFWKPFPEYSFNIDGQDKKQRRGMTQLKKIGRQPNQLGGGVKTEVERSPLCTRMIEGKRSSVRMGRQIVFSTL